MHHWYLKHSKNMSWVFNTFDVWTKKLNHVFNEDKYYCLFFIYKKQLDISKQLLKKHYILNVEQGFLDRVYTEVYISKFVHYDHSHKDRFLKEKKGERFLFSWIFYHSSKFNLTTVGETPANKIVVGLLSFLVVWVSDTVNM